MACDDDRRRSRKPQQIPSRFRLLNAFGHDRQTCKLAADVLLRYVQTATAPLGRAVDPVDGPGFRGGQSVSFVARAKDGSGPVVFIKHLHPRRVTNLEARRRFKREVGAYEALAGLGPPRIFDNNADTWEDRRTPMNMATEFINGVNLQDYVEAGYAIDVDAILACVSEPAIVLNRCHAPTTPIAALLANEQRLPRPSHPRACSIPLLGSTYAAIKTWYSNSTAKQWIRDPSSGASRNAVN